MGRKKKQPEVMNDDSKDIKSSPPEVTDIIAAEIGVDDNDSVFVQPIDDEGKPEEQPASQPVVEVTDLNVSGDTVEEVVSKVQLSPLSDYVRKKNRYIDHIRNRHGKT